MTQTIANPGHDDMIHDAILDYYGRRLATCSSDRTIKIFEVDGDNHRLLDTLKGHDSPIFTLSYTHPKHSTILASGDFAGKVLLWRENPPSSPSAYTKLIDFALHTASVNAVAWAPHELGAHLACASSDGAVSVLSFSGDAPASNAGTAWDTAIFQAHPTGVNAVSWAPAFPAGALESAASPAGNPAHAAVRRLATAGSDAAVRVWEYSPQGGTYGNVVTLAGHTDWVRDVAWSGNLLSATYIASGSQDGTVRIWTLGQGAELGVAENWQCKTLEFECEVWRVSWSLSGNVLAVSGGDNKVSLWKERVRDGGWECVKTMEE